MSEPSRQPTVLEPDAVAEIVGEPLGSLPGVTNAVLNDDGTSITGILTVEKGHRLGRHQHRHHVHHMWVLDGEARIAERLLGPRSYVHIPVGVEHDIDATATDGVTVYYSYVRPLPTIPPP